MARAPNLLVILFHLFCGETSIPLQMLDNEPEDRCNYLDSSDFEGEEVRGDGHEYCHTREMSEGDLCKMRRAAYGSEHPEGRGLDYPGGDELRKRGYPTICD